MKVARVIYKHFMGFEDWEFEPGKITKISGPNAAGKTSAITGLRDLIGGGHNAALIRDGHDEAVIGIELEPQGSVFKTIKQDRYDLDIEKDDPLDETTPMAYVKSLFSDFAANPVKYITEPDKREQWIAESLPISVTLKDLQKAIGKISNVDPKYADMPAIAAIDKLHKLLYKARRDHNRNRDEKKKSIESLKSEIPDELIGEDMVQEELDSLSERKDQFNSELQAELNKIDESLEDQIEKLRKRAGEAKFKIRASYGDSLDQISNAISEAQTTLKHASASNASIKMFTKMQDEYTALKEKSDLYEFALGGLKKLKSKKLEEIPIDGLTIEEGEIYADMDGEARHFDKLNLATKIDIVMRLALLHAEKQNTKIKLILLDDAEHLDEDSQAEIVKWVDNLDRDDVMVIMTFVQSRDEDGEKLEGLKVEKTR